eukprot:TRINITY_DN3879_c0_g3_i1.p1 TRINITY_DN3879_c0_g3~~TRINITY_DN3879_c0_g3_i1.p1  ORF type:complete len:510 (-),score=59.55 TRINITY_DN3879_c0_g3_i1:928-2259(-)
MFKCAIWVLLVSSANAQDLSLQTQAILRYGEIRRMEGNCPANKCLDHPPVFDPVPCFAWVAQQRCDDEVLRGYCECACERCDPESPVEDRYCPRHCSDGRPPSNSSFTCLEHRAQGSCEADWMQGYCQCTCGMCPIQFSEDEQVTSITATSRSVGNFAEDVQSATADAIASLKSGDMDPVAASQAVATTIARAVAEAVAETRIVAQVSGNGTAIGEATATAQSIAIATANATASAFAKAGDSASFVDAATFATQLKVAIVNSSVSLIQQGIGSTTVQDVVIETAVAQVVAEATAKAFASIVGESPTAITFASATAIPAAECPEGCWDESPGSLSCIEESARGNCERDYMLGFCECTCGKCDTRTDFVNITDTIINSNINSQQTPEQINNTMEKRKSLENLASNKTLSELDRLEQFLLNETYSAFENVSFSNIFYSLNMSMVLY